MQLPQTPRGRALATALAAAALAGATTGALAASAAQPAATASSPSLPAGPPTDAALAKLTVINRTITPAPTSNRGFNGFQTVTVRAPAGKTVLQGFATLTGGNAGSVVIRSTRSFTNRYVVNLVFPGEQGTPGRLHVRVQLLPAE